MEKDEKRESGYCTAGVDVHIQAKPTTATSEATAAPVDCTSIALDVCVLLLVEPMTALGLVSVPVAVLVDGRVGASTPLLAELVAAAVVAAVVALLPNGIAGSSVVGAAVVGSRCHAHTGGSSASRSTC